MMAYALCHPSRYGLLHVSLNLSIGPVKDGCDPVKVACAPPDMPLPCYALNDDVKALQKCVQAKCAKACLDIPVAVLALSSLILHDTWLARGDPHG